MQPVAGLIEVMRVARYVEIGQYATDAPDVAGIQPSGVASLMEPPQSRMLDLHPGIFVRYTPCCNPEHPANESISFCARAGLRNPDLARAMARARTGFIDKRRAAVEALPEYPQLRRVEREFDERLTPPRARLGLRTWAFAARPPALYRLVASFAMRVLGLLGRFRGRFRRLPLAGGWTATRDLPAPAGETFMAAWAKRRKERAAGGTG